MTGSIFVDIIYLDTPPLPQKLPPLSSGRSTLLKATARRKSIPIMWKLLSEFRLPGDINMQTLAIESFRNSVRFGNMH